MLPQPDDPVPIIIRVPRVMRKWGNDHSSQVNFTGLYKEILRQIIQTKDPVFYEQHREIFEGLEIRKLERTQVLLQQMLSI